MENTIIRSSLAATLDSHPSVGVGRAAAWNQRTLPALPWSWTTRSSICHYLQEKTVMLSNRAIPKCNDTPREGEARVLFPEIEALGHG